MAIAGCSCSGKFSNNGIPNVKPFGVTKTKYLVPLNADDGTRNGLDLTTALGPQILAAVNNPDPSKRWYPFNDIQNNAPTESDANFETTDLGERYKTRNGIVTESWQVWGVDTRYFDKVKSACIEFGIVDVDVCGNMRLVKEGTMGYPRPANKSSYHSMFVDATADASSKVTFTYDFDYTSSYADLWMLPLSEFGTYNPLYLYGLIDVNLAITPTSATEATVVASFDYGNAASPMAWTGGVVGDLTLNNLTAGGTLAVGTFIESTTTPGTYALTYTAGTTSDVLELEVFRAASAIKINGYENTGTQFSQL